MRAVRIWVWMTILAWPAAVWAEEPAPRSAARGTAARPAARAPAPPASLDETIRSILRKHNIPAASAGILAAAPDGSEIYYALNPDRPCIPASNVKLWTTAAALDALGPDYRFSTTLTLVGEVEDATLHGHIWVTGRGDPTISGRFENGDRYALMKRWADDLLAAGIRYVTGHVVGDDDFLDDVMRPPDWKPAHYAEWYGAPVSALSFDDNCVQIHWRPGAAVNRPAQYSINPDVGVVALKSSVRTAARGANDGRYYIAHVGNPTFEALGTVQLGRTSPVTDNLPVDNPTLYFTAAFKKVLESKGIAVGGEAVDQDEAQVAVGRGVPVRRFAVALSPELSQVVAVINQRSQNFYAEMLLKTLGREVGQEGSYAAGVAAVRDYMWRSGIPLEGFHLADGSGLAATNQVTPRQFVALLSAVDRSPTRHLFWDSLPVAGARAGSMRNRLQSGAGQRRLAEHVRAKTGSINTVRALTGACRPESGRPFYFSILLNDIPGAGYAGTPAIDEIVLALHEATRN